MQSEDSGNDDKGESVWSWQLIWPLIWPLITKARSGDRDAATDLIRVEEFVSWCKSIAEIVRRGGIDGDYRDINDFLQDILLKIWKRIDQFKGSTQPELFGWVFQIARNLQNDYLKQVKKERDVFEKNGLDKVDCPSPEDPYEQARANSLRDELKKFMDGLNDFDRRILDGRLQDESLDEIARALGSSTSTVHRHLREKIQKPLAEKFKNRNH